MAEEGPGLEHGGKLQGGDAHLAALGDDQLVGVLDHLKGFFLGRPEVEGDELAGLLGDDQASA